jgi:hypothetical protein
MFDRPGRDLFRASAVVFVVVLGCSTNTTGSGEGENISDPAALEASMDNGFLPAVMGIVNGFARLATAADGGSAEGVTIVPTGSDGFQGDVTIDFDGDGTRESTLSGFVTGDIETGAAVTITGLAQPDASGLSLSASTTVTETSPVTILFDDLQATMNVNRDATGNAAQAMVTDGTISVDLVSGTPSGFADVRVSEEGQSAEVTILFESDGLGGWRVRVTGDGINFTVT